MKEGNNWSVWHQVVALQAFQVLDWIPHTHTLDGQLEEHEEHFTEISQTKRVMDYNQGLHL